MLYLSAAFDTMDNKIIFGRLVNEVFSGLILRAHLSGMRYIVAIYILKKSDLYQFQFNSVLLL